ncbi:efflux RND transporter periplasmic adaptor subunit [Sedimentibacter hydroxybenzoicus DSM 7310]|uniref:Efflux RND transporter periplasmic adaptor subunit n=1 Tax=Sedimentibacter hydroxybenzoicus DSM 7310 TaxID=1123245 RepID=A0A974GY25_SEDHY|nr:efflux RND transporter periplasmic adaptor subunit [Sedimentibacter hydroxybenzoicus]NYB75685.1 efflux RND transporter periplasmic adaptor subunit [Sedimentibacter hydroxybenzoicus DSM 7310]
MILKKSILIFLIILLSLSMYGCTPKESAAPVEEIDLSQDKKIIESFGVVKAEDSMDIIIDFTSVVTDILVSNGQHIKLDEPILILDMSQYEVQVSDIKSQLNIAELEYEQIKLNSKDNQQTEMDKLKSNLEFAEKVYSTAVSEFNNNESLYKERAITEDTYNQSKKNLNESKNKVDNIKFEIRNTLDSINKKAESEIIEKAVQMENIMQLKSKLEALENKLNKQYIRENQIVSHYNNAVIYDIQYDTGHITDVSKKAFSIADLDSLIIEAEVVEEFIKDIQTGARVRIVPVADRMREYEGSVKYISQMAFKNNGETIVPIKISIDNNDSFLLPNYNIDVYIEAK